MKLENHEYENALLGCILLDNRVLDEYKVKPTLFDNALNRRVFGEIEKSRAGGFVADIREIALRIPDVAAQVARLTDVPSAANVKFYFDNLVELARRRGLSKLARDVSSMAIESDSSGDVFTYIDRVLVEIAENETGGYKHISAFVPDAMKDIEKAMKAKGKISGITTGFHELDDRTNGWQDGDYIVIGARPSRGKTALALNMISAAARAGHKPGLFSIEMSAKSIIKRLISDWSTVSYSGIQNGLMNPNLIPQIADAASALFVQSIFIDETPNIKLSDLVSSARKMRRNDKVDIIFMDYLGLIDNKQTGLARWEQVSEISKAIKGLARELKIPIVSLSQLTRETEAAKPTMANLRDSGSIEQDADIIGLLHRVGYTDNTNSEALIDFLLEKARNGTTGEIHMVFKPSYMRFKEVEK
jgi:replicative DNA helicase